MLKMKKLGYILFVVAVLSTGQAYGQGFGTIFRAGLNISSFNGPTLMDANGQSLEEYGYGTGFHIGAGARYKFDYSGNYGVSMEFLYSLKGGLISYEGESWYTFRNPQGASITTTGTRRMALDVSNSYLEFPVSFFAKFGKFELHGGAYMGVRLRSIANGDYRYMTTSPNNLNFSVLLDQNFRNDRLPDYSMSFPSNEVELLEVAGELFQVPTTQGAYFEHPEFNGSLYKALDFGLIGGFSYYLTDGLFLGFRFQYGLTDVTRDDMHLNLNRLGDDNQPLLRSEVQRNIVYQASVGFAF